MKRSIEEYRAEAMLMGCTYWENLHVYVPQGDFEPLISEWFIDPDTHEIVRRHQIIDRFMEKTLKQPINTGAFPREVIEEGKDR